MMTTEEDNDKPRDEPIDHLSDLIKKSVAQFKALSPEEQLAMFKSQRESFVRGEMGMEETSFIKRSEQSPEPADALETIRHLRAQLEEQIDLRNDQCRRKLEALSRAEKAEVERDDLRAEVERLREALSWYSDDPSSQGDVARAALTDGGTK
jgi:hypothetical protein